MNYCFSNESWNFVSKIVYRVYVNVFNNCRWRYSWLAGSQVYDDFCYIVVTYFGTDLAIIYH
jgi:hypothetical protein